MATRPLRVIPLGGLGEVGKNMMALEYDGDIIVIDCGVLFPEQDMPGVDLVIPDITYLVEHQAQVKAILITHGHEDHTGALPYVLPNLPVPVYAPRLAHGLISVKLKERRELRGTRLELVEPGKPIKFGKFRAEFFPVCHSIPDAMGLAIETPVGLVIHSGDFKIDHTPVDGKATEPRPARDLRFPRSAPPPLRFPPMPSCPAIPLRSKSWDRRWTKSSVRLRAASWWPPSASLISRIQQVIDAAARHNRKVGIVGRSMVDNVKMSIDMGYLTAPPGVLLTVGETKRLSSERVVLVTTGSQGEPTSALVRIANRDHRDIQLIPGDTVVISATPIPGNETVISSTIDNLFRQGARVLYDKVALVHVHGHASQEELKLVLNLIKPRFFVPIHGEYHHLVAHASLARAMGVPESGIFTLEDGNVLELTQDEGRVTSSVPAGHIFVDGHTTIPAKSPVFRDRRALSHDGVVVVVVALDKATGLPARPPEVTSRGFMDPEGLSGVLAKVSASVAEALDHTPNFPIDWRSTNSLVEATVSKLLLNETGRRPTIMPVGMEV